jgi:putative ATP-dependent endonuclease of the OLD family
MRLRKIEIENFKGLKAATLEPGAFSCLIGENNAGKSSVLQAMASLLNRPGQIATSLYYDPGLPIVFKGYFDGVTEAHLARLAEDHRAKIAPLVIDEKLTIVSVYKAEQKLELRVQRPVPKDARYTDDTIDERLKGKKGGAIRAAFEEHYPEFLSTLPSVSNLGEAKAHLRSCISALAPDQFEVSEVALPTGIASSISNLMPEAIYIPAVKNLNDDLKTTQSTSFGRLLGLLLEDMAPDLLQVQQALASLHKLLNRTQLDGEVQDERHAKVRELEQLVEQMLAENFPTATVEFEVPPPELRAILSTAQIYINDGSREPIDQKGDGIKRSLTFALLRAYVSKLNTERQSKAENPPESRPLIFLFEEPELYLHPKAQRILFGTLASISKSYQVVVTTHSPLFFEPGVTAVFVRVAKRDMTPKPIGELHTVNFELDKDKADTFRLARYEHAEAGFFSSRVVLFEGESDDAFLSHVASLLGSQFDFRQHNVALVRVGGKGNFANYRRFFESFGIEVKLVADLDAMFEGFQHLGASDECNSLRNETLKAIDARSAELNITGALSGQRLKKRIVGFGYREMYEGARRASAKLQAGATLDAAEIAAIGQLFECEREETRLLTVQADSAAKQAMIPLLDKLRNLGICVLSKGAIEDYYPETVNQSLAKPQRALHASTLVTCGEDVAKLCPPLELGRDSELHQVFTAIFS